jgi:UDPglucose 6-dehydrogenase
MVMVWLVVELYEKLQINNRKMKIAVAGTGYVGLSIATLLAQHNEVIAVDIIPEKVDMINKRISPIQDEYIEKFFAEKELNLTATLDGAAAYKDAEIVVIAAPTNYDPVKNFFDTHHIEDVIDYFRSIRKQRWSSNLLFQWVTPVHSM